MLKLERKSRDGQVDLFVSHRDTMIDRSLLVAFSIAVAIHLSFLLLFHVGSFSFQIETLLPPVGVTIDSQLVSTGISLVVEHSPITTIQGIPIPMLRQPRLEEHPSLPVVYPDLFVGDGALDVDLFALLERTLYDPMDVVTREVHREPMNIVVSGELSSREIVAMPTALPYMSNSGETKQELRVVYEVRVDGRSGHIIWFEPKQTSHLLALDRAVEKGLRQILFAKEVGGTIMDGEIEFHISSI